MDDEARREIIHLNDPGRIATHLCFPAPVAPLRPRADQTDLVHFIVSSRPRKPAARIAKTGKYACNISFLIQMFMEAVNPNQILC